MDEETFGDLAGGRGFWLFFFGCLAVFFWLFFCLIRMERIACCLHCFHLLSFFSNALENVPTKKHL